MLLGIIYIICEGKVLQGLLQVLFYIFWQIPTTREKNRKSDSKNLLVTDMLRLQSLFIASGEALDLGYFNFFENKKKKRQSDKTVERKKINPN